MRKEMARPAMERKSNRTIKAKGNRAVVVEETVLLLLLLREAQSTRVSRTRMAAIAESQTIPRWVKMVVVEGKDRPGRRVQVDEGIKSDQGKGARISKAVSSEWKRAMIHRRRANLAGRMITPVEMLSKDVAHV